jgi:hypothetical protein
LSFGDTGVTQLALTGGTEVPGQEVPLLVQATSEVVRVMGVWVRRADAGLLDQATRNAAAGVAEPQARRMDEARTMRDLRRLRPAEQPLIRMRPLEGEL